MDKNVHTREIWFRWSLETLHVQSWQLEEENVTGMLHSGVAVACAAALVQRVHLLC